MRHPSRIIAELAVVVLFASCGSSDDTAADETAATTAAPATTVAPAATVAAPATSATTEATTTTKAPDTTTGAMDPAFAAYCEKNLELVDVRGQVYGPPFDETPGEIEALLTVAKQ